MCALFVDNAGVIVNPKGEMKGTYIVAYAHHSGKKKTFLLAKDLEAKASCPVSFLISALCLLYHLSLFLSHSVSHPNSDCEKDNETTNLYLGESNLILFCFSHRLS